MSAGQRSGLVCGELQGKWEAHGGVLLPSPIALVAQWPSLSDGVVPVGQVR